MTVFNIDTNKFITGGVARYSIDCLLCETGNITLINHLMLNHGFIGNVMGISAMANYPTKHLMFLSTAWEIYTITPTNEMKLIHKLRNLDLEYDYYNDCTVLSVDNSKQRLLSICGQRDAPLINI